MNPTKTVKQQRKRTAAPSSRKPRKSRSTAPAPTSPAQEPRVAPRPLLSPVYGIVDPLSTLMRWARLTLHDRIVSSIGLHVDRSAVVILDTLHHDGPMRMSDLAGKIGLDRSTVSRQVAAVVKAGLVDRADDTNDARAALLSLSARGQSVRQQVSQSWQSIAMELISDWSHEEQVEFDRLMSKLAQRLREEMKP